MASQGTTMTIDAGVMHAAASSIDVQRGIIENCLNSIKQDADALKPIWEGASATSYQGIITQIANDSPKVVNILKEYVHDLTEIASEFQTNEQIRKTQSEALPNNIFG